MIENLLKNFSATKMNKSYVFMDHASKNEWI